MVPYDMFWHNIAREVFWIFLEQFAQQYMAKYSPDAGWNHCCSQRLNWMERLSLQKMFWFLGCLKFQRCFKHHALQTAPGRHGHPALGDAGANVSHHCQSQTPKEPSIQRLLRWNSKFKRTWDNYITGVRPSCFQRWLPLCKGSWAIEIQQPPRQATCLCGWKDLKI